MAPGWMRSIIFSERQSKEMVIRNHHCGEKRIPGTTKLICQPAKCVGRYSAYVNHFANQIRHTGRQRLRLSRYSENAHNPLINFLTFFCVLIHSHANYQFAVGNVVVTFVMFSHVKRSRTFKVKRKHILKIGSQCLKRGASVHESTCLR